MQPALPINIQTAKVATGKMPGALGGKTLGAQIPGEAGVAQDFSSILSMITGKASPQVGKVLAADAMMGKMAEGEMPSAELTPEQALELKLQGTLTSPKAANFSLFGEIPEAQEQLGKPLIATEKGNIKVQEKVLNSAETLNLETQDLEKILATKEPKSLVLPQNQTAELLSKGEGEAMVKKNMMGQMPNQKPEVVLADNVDLLNLRQNMKNSKAHASKEYTKGQNPFETNVIQLKKEAKLEKDLSKIESETMKPLELLARESSSPFQHVQRDPQMSIALGGAAQGTKGLDLSGVQNNTEIINKIVTYLEQQNIQTRDNLEVAVKHDSLGQFNINVQKASKGDEVSIQILTNSDAGRDFFVKNENLLNKTLADSGVKVADFRLGNLGTENMMGSKQNTDSGFSGSFSGHDQNGQRYYSEKQQSENQDSRRRQELWEQYRERSLA